MPTNSAPTSDDAASASSDGHEPGPSERQGSSVVIITVVAVLLGLIAVGLLVPHFQTKIYQGTATLKMSGPPVVTGPPGTAIVSYSIIGPAEVSAILTTVSSKTVRDQVAAHRLTGADLRQFMAPYTGAGASVSDILRDNFKASPRRGTLMLDFQYQHPDPAVAAKVANFFAEELLALSPAAFPAGVSVILVDPARPSPPDAYIEPVNYFRRMMQWFKR